MVSESKRFFATGGRFQYLPNVRVASGAAGRPARWGLQWWTQMSRGSASVLVGTGLSASAIKLQDACVLGILNGAEMA